MEQDLIQDLKWYPLEDVAPDIERFLFFQKQRTGILLLRTLRHVVPERRNSWTANGIRDQCLQFEVSISIPCAKTPTMTISTYLISWFTSPELVFVCNLTIIKVQNTASHLLVFWVEHLIWSIKINCIICCRVFDLTRRIITNALLEKLGSKRRGANKSEAGLH